VIGAPEATVASRGVRLSTKAKDVESDFYHNAPHATAQTIKAKIFADDESAIDITARPAEGDPSPTVVLIQPDGTPYSNLAAFEDDDDYYDVPILQTGKHHLEVTSTVQAGNLAIYVTVLRPLAGDVVEID